MSRSPESFCEYWSGVVLGSKIGVAGVSGTTGVTGCSGSTFVWKIGVAFGAGDVMIRGRPPACSAGLAGSACCGEGRLMSGAA